MLHAIHPEALTPESAGSVAAASTKVTQNVAVNMLENLAEGKPAFKPELGKAGCSWFVSEGNPHVGIDAAKNVEVPVEITKPADPVQFNSEELVKMRDAELAKIEMAELEAKYRAHQNIPADKPLNSKARKGLERLAKQLAETRMWDEVGKRVRASAAKVGEVVLKNSEFSKSADGKFLVVADASKIQVKGGVNAVVQALEQSGVKAEPVLVKAAEEMATRLKWQGRVTTAFRWGGRVLIVLAVAADAYKIYKAQDRLKATLSSAGGWATSIAASALFAKVAAPVNAAGPAGMVAYGIGILVSGGVGYWVGSETTTLVYELVVE